MNGATTDRRSTQPPQTPDAAALVERVAAVIDEHPGITEHDIGVDWVPRDGWRLDEELIARGYWLDLFVSHDPESPVAAGLRWWPPGRRLAEMCSCADAGSERRS